MSLIFATQLAAIATAVLAVGAIITAVFAILAFRKQSDAVRDGRQLIGQQRDMLQVQSDRLEVYRGRVDEQRQINSTHGHVLQLQAEEIAASFRQREHDAEEQRRKQAARVTAWFDGWQAPAVWVEGARVRNASDEPIFDVRVFFHHMRETDGAGRHATRQR
jgi:AcrR family transcriptional regulator